MADKAANPAAKLGEFGRIARHFAPLAAGFAGARGLIDDTASLIPGDDREIVVTTDAVVAGVHFIGDEPADLIARKALRVNLSDLAAAGAVPLAYTLTTILPASLDDAWVAAFALGLAADQAEFGIHLAGGDSVATPGPAVLSITAFGTVPRGGALTRSGARPGDLVYVSGTLGDAALGLAVAQGRLAASAEHAAFLVDRYRLPQPRLGLGRRLQGIASAALDISDGLVGDLGHIATASGVALTLDAAALPLSPAGRAAVDRDPSLLALILGGGDDYELALTISPQKAAIVERCALDAGVPLTRIGQVEAGAPSVCVTDEAGRDITPAASGYRHF
jgi:thiamine-monophosphate kinase